MHDLHAGGSAGVDQTAQIDQHGTDLLLQSAERGQVTDHAPLALVDDDGGVGGIDQRGIERHGRTLTRRSR
jgi:hypothetical protein